VLRRWHYGERHPKRRRLMMPATMKNASNSHRRDNRQLIKPLARLRQRHLLSFFAMRPPNASSFNKRTVCRVDEARGSHLGRFIQDCIIVAHALLLDVPRSHLEARVDHYTSRSPCLTSSYHSRQARAIGESVHRIDNLQYPLLSRARC
jgi:hypothetical protein